MGEKEWNPTEVFDLFGDDLSRRILILASEEPVSADEIATTLDTSHPTVYRRINALAEYDLVREHQMIDADGNHFKTFETTLRRIAFEVDEGGYNIDIQMRQDLVEQFSDFWSGLSSSSLGDSADSIGENDASEPSRDPHYG